MRSPVVALFQLEDEVAVALRAERRLDMVGLLVVSGIVESEGPLFAV